ncbi:hypothetical protein [Amycolatopsis sp. YIM 10]|uniref:hypothetical protein n=1 Tax=Amycolatopsis sp. YIM 10 TaxID=2653857 RepID=UPI0012A8D676|nr:hypothetical protein [Amycolatopsis sp. YIM 10]QFU89257.1 hypothetical protein YIM_20390 [Amycolatopsis sp. YIM 10]
MSGVVVEELLTALRKVPGLRPATPATVPSLAWVPWDWDDLAVTVTPELVEIRLVATKLPLPPVLGHAEELLTPVLPPGARLRLVVTDIDRVALNPHRESDLDYPIGS